MHFATLLLLVTFFVHGNPVFAADAAGLTLSALDDFPNIAAGSVPYYKDAARKALAINAANTKYRSQFARAECTFTGAAGNYDVTITTLTEEDGECTFRLLINGTSVGTYKNPRVDKKGDSKPNTHVWSGITISAQAKIAIESDSHSNDLIPENGGFAWARGRWQKIELRATKK